MMIGNLAQHDLLQAAGYCFMVFSLSVWVLSIISLIFASMVYLGVVWHVIPKDEGLSQHCTRKVNKRLREIVRSQSEKADMFD